MARILYDDGFTGTPIITLKNRGGSIISPLVGDINDLDAGPARFLLQSSLDEVRLEFSNSSEDDVPEAVVVVASIVESNEQHAPSANLTRTTTLLGTGLPPTDIFGTDVGLRRRGQRQAFATLIPATGQTHRISFSSTMSFGTVAFDIERIAWLKSYNMNRNISLSYSLSYDDLSTVNQSDSGATFTTLRRRKKVLRVSTPPNEETSDIMPSVGGFARILEAVGNSRELMLLAREDDSDFARQIAFLGRITTDLAEISHVERRLFTVGPFTITES